MADGVWDLCNRCWAEKPSDRPDASQLVEAMKKEVAIVGSVGGYTNGHGNGNGQG